MSNKFFPLFFFLVLFLFGQASGEEVFTGDVTVNLGPKVQKGMKQLYPWLENSQAVKLGPYKIYRPDVPGDLKLWVVGPTSTKMVAVKKDSFSIVTEGSTIGINDRNGDGIFEIASYDTIDSAGKTTGTVYDWNRDGDPDYKVVFSGDQNIPGKHFVPYSGEWWQLLFKEGRTWVKLDGEPLEVKKEGNRYVPVK